MTTRTRSSKIVEKISPQGRLFSRLVQTTTSLEKNWVNWKADSCKPYELEPFVDHVMKKRKKLSGSLSSRRDYLGNDDMTKLWEKGNNIDVFLRNHL